MTDRRTPATAEESAALHNLDPTILFVPDEYKTKVPNFVNLGIRKITLNLHFDHYYSASFVGQKTQEVF